MTRIRSIALVVLVVPGCATSLDGLCLARTVENIATTELAVITSLFGDSDDDALRKAAKKGDLARIEALLKSGVNVDSADKKGRTARFVSGARLIAATMVTKLPPRPSGTDSEKL